MQNRQHTFYTIPIQPRLVVRPTEPNLNQNQYTVTFEPNYLSQPCGIIRLLLVIFQLGGIVSAACITKLFTILPDEYTITRDSYLAFSIVGFIVSLVIFILCIMNAISKNTLWNLIVLLLDVVWLIPMFILAIICAVKEGNVKDQLFLNDTYVNKGGFAAASSCAFLTALLYAIDAGIQLVNVIRRLSSSK